MPNASKTNSRKPARVVRTGKAAKLAPDAKLGQAAKAAADAGRSNVAKPVKPEAAPSKPSANVNRTIATIAKQACNFGGTVSDRDSAYIAFYASLARALPGGVVTIRAIAESGRKPAYNGSAKPHDAGVVQRLHKAGIVAASPDGSSFTFTKHGQSLKAYSGK